MTAREEKLKRYRSPSSNNEQEKQDRAERLVKTAVNAWLEFQSTDVKIKYVPKGSYTNNTNVRLDSDVDIAVVRTDFHYFDASALGEADKIHPSSKTFLHEGVSFRNSLAASIKSDFGDDCDITGTTAIELKENQGHVKADIVPAFEYRKYYYDALGNISFHKGQKVFRTDGTSVVNYPDQQLENGRTKNLLTGTRYKQLVRILKNAENELVVNGKMKALPSYFMECLVYQVPNELFNHRTDTPLTDDLRQAVVHVWGNTQPGGNALHWLEPNEIKPLFGTEQKWSMEQAHEFMAEVWELFDLVTED